MSHVGRTDRAVAHLIERYSPYLPGHRRNPVPAVLQGPYGGPLPEYWISREDLDLKAGEKNTAQPADETGSHGWGAVPLLWLHESLLGVTITEPGGGEILVAPDAGGLAYVAGHTVTPRGLVWVRWDPQQGSLAVDVPANVVARVRMPAVCRDKRVEATQAPDAVERLDDTTFRLRTAGRYVFAVK